MVVGRALAGAGGWGFVPWVRAVAVWSWSAHDCVELVVLARFGRVGVVLCAKTRHCCKNAPTRLAEVSPGLSRA